jgi:hypothetical protein
MNINDLAQDAINALEQINAIFTAWDKAAAKKGSYQGMVARPHIDDALHLLLLDAIVDFDGDPQRTFDQLRFELSDDSDPEDYDGGRFDYVTGQAGSGFYA